MGGVNEVVLKWGEGGGGEGAPRGGALNGEGGVIKGVGADDGVSKRRGS